MTQEEARKLAEVMLAYADGKEIEYRIKGEKIWESARGEGEVGFMFDDYEYRIKPEPTYRPFKDKEECFAEMRKHEPLGWTFTKNTGVYHSIASISDTVVSFSNGFQDDFKHLLKYTVFADGTPFGIKEE